MRLPSVSIVIPAYNQERFIARCIRSVVNQDFNRNDYEIIVIDDGSTDQTYRVLERFTDVITLFRNEQNEGLPASLNRGIRSARGRFIVRVDADDFVHEQYVNLLYQHLMLNQSLDAVECDYILVDENGKYIRVIQADEKPIGCGIMFRAEHLIQLGLYDESMRYHEDQDMRIRFLKNHKIYRIPLPLYRYCRHGNNMTNNQDLARQYSQHLKAKHQEAGLAYREEMR